MHMHVDDEASSLHCKRVVAMGISSDICIMNVCGCNECEWM